MAHQPNQDELIELDNLEIAPLSDDDLENVVGGWCSCWCCSKIIIEPPSEEIER